MPARLLPCFSSRVMLARDDAVSAVSLPAKNADSSRQNSTMTRESQSFAVIILRMILSENRFPLFGIMRSACR